MLSLPEERTTCRRGAAALQDSSTNDQVSGQARDKYRAACVLAVQPRALQAYLFTDVLVGANEPTRVTDRAMFARGGYGREFAVRTLIDDLMNGLRQL
jgi:hypothetical protein